MPGKNIFLLCIISSKIRKSVFRVIFITFTENIWSPWKICPYFVLFFYEIRESVFREISVFCKPWAKNHISPHVYISPIHFSCNFLIFNTSFFYGKEVQIHFTQQIWTNGFFFFGTLNIIIVKYGEIWFPCRTWLFLFVHNHDNCINCYVIRYFDVSLWVSLIC